MSKSDVDLVSSGSDTETTRAIVRHFRNRLTGTDVQKAVGLARNVRDKRIAHNEDVRELSGPTWEAILDLIKLAQDLVGIVGWAYLSIVYVIKDRYVLTPDAERTSRALGRLLEEANLLPNARRGSATP